MANANWQGGKSKSRVQSKAWILHNDAESRENVNHKNTDIRKELTYLNDSIGVTGDMSYEQKCARLDALLEDYGYKEVAGKNARVMLQSVCIYPPDGLLEYDEDLDIWRKTPELQKWFELADAEFDAMAGEECTVDAVVDYDEQHWYTPEGETEQVLSKPHLHKRDVPIVDGRISGKEFSSRARINELNKRLEAMTQREFGMQWNTGKGKNPKGNKSVEELKAVSERIESVIFDMDKAFEVIEEAEQLRDETAQLISDMQGDSYTGEDGKTYAGLKAIRETRNKLAEEGRKEQSRLSKATASADEQERRADSAAKRADSARAIASQAEQRLQATQDKENKVMQNVTDAQKLLDEWEQFVTTIEDNLKTSNAMVQTWDAYSEIVHETGLYDKQSETDKAAFNAVQAARDNNPWAEMYETVLELLRKLRQFKQRMQAMQSERAHADTSTVDFSRSEQNDFDYGR